MKRALSLNTNIGNYQCHIIHKSQELSCKRCRYLAHSSNNTEVCEGFRKNNNVHTIRSPENPMCNLYACHINIYGKDFNSSEQAYQWCFVRHLGRDDLAEEIMMATTAANAKEVASRIPRHLHGTWHDNKLELMNDIQDAKVKYCSEFFKALIQSTGYKLVESVRTDRFWSCGLTPRDAAISILSGRKQSRAHARIYSRCSAIRFYQHFL